MDLDGPALAPPDGVTSNLINPPNRNVLALGVLTTCAAIATICFFVRAYGRVYLVRKFQTEELLVTLAFGCFWGCATATYKLVKVPGYFVHQWNVRLGDVIPTQYWVLVFGVCYSFVIPCLKIAILVEWCRVFVLPGTRLKSFFWWGAMFIIFVQVSANIAIVVALNMQCVPHRRIWDFTIDGECWELYKLQVASASIHLSCDIIMFLLPQRMIWTLKMSWKKRLGISVIFGLGLVACISAGFRLAVTITHGKAADAIYTLAPLAFWATAEMTCGFFIVCIPCIPKILRESGALSVWKRRFGIKSKDREPRSTVETYGGSGVTNSKLTTSSSNAYYKLDEDGIPMKTLAESESTEQLHERSNHDSMTGVTVTKTTQVQITHSDYNESGNSRLYLKSQQPWPRPQ